MEIYYVIISLAYFAFCILLIIGWHKLPLVEPGSWKNDDLSSEKVSVVIAVRNEAENIGALIDDLDRQTYPKHLFEVIIVDDHSNDGTANIIKNQQLGSHINLVYIRSDYAGNPAVSPKKRALQQGIEKARGTIVLTTDGDCRVGPGWIKTFAGFFAKNPFLFVAGPVSFHPVISFLDHFQELDFASLIGTGAASIALGFPLICNGANLAFRRTAFDQVHGHQEFERIISGDDVFLMQQVHLQFPGKVAFLKSHEAVVRTAEPDLKSFVQQRRRWAGKWHQYLFAWSRGVPVFVFCFHLSTLVMVALVFLAYFKPVVLLAGVFVRLLLEYLFLNKILLFQGKRLKLHHFTSMALLYPLYAVLFGVLANVRGFEWKGRKFDDDGNDRPGI